MDKSKRDAEKRTPKNKDSEKAQGPAKDLPVKEQEADDVKGGGARQASRRPA